MLYKLKGAKSLALVERTPGPIVLVMRDAVTDKIRLLEDEMTDSPQCKDINVQNKVAGILSHCNEQIFKETIYKFYVGDEHLYFLGAYDMHAKPLSDRINCNLMMTLYEAGDWIRVLKYFLLSNLSEDVKSMTVRDYQLLGEDLTARRQQVLSGLPLGWNVVDLESKADTLFVLSSNASQIEALIKDMWPTPQLIDYAIYSGEYEELKYLFKGEDAIKAELRKDAIAKTIKAVDENLQLFYRSSFTGEDGYFEVVRSRIPQGFQEFFKINKKPIMAGAAAAPAELRRHLIRWIASTHGTV